MLRNVLAIVNTVLIVVGLAGVAALGSAVNDLSKRLDDAESNARLTKESVGAIASYLHEQQELTAGSGVTASR